MRLGAHVPIRGHLQRALDATLEIGGETLQIFISNPRGWAPPTLTPQVAREFRERRKETGLGPVFVHASYLVNIASPSDDFRARAVDLARRELEAAEAIGADGLIVHSGAGGREPRGAALERAVASCLAILSSADGPELVLELTAGGTGAVASTISDAAELLIALGHHPRVGLCLDTCHLFAAGAPLDVPEGVTRTFADLRRYRLSRRLRVLQANDAKDPRGSRRDRHEHIGEGHIGDAGFRAILAQPAVRRASVIIETPGDLDDDRRNLERLRRLS